jgi:hypothetical protein
LVPVTNALAILQSPSWTNKKEILSTKYEIANNRKEEFNSSHPISNDQENEGFEFGKLGFNHLGYV